MLEGRKAFVSDDGDNDGETAGTAGTAGTAVAAGTAGTAGTAGIATSATSAASAATVATAIAATAIAAAAPSATNVATNASSFHWAMSPMSLSNRSPCLTKACFSTCACVQYGCFSASGNCIQDCDNTTLNSRVDNCSFCPRERCRCTTRQAWQ